MKQANELFKMEFFDVAESIPKNTKSLYLSSKSDILKRLPTCNYESVTDAKTNDSAIIIDLLFFTKSDAVNKKFNIY